MKLLTEKGDQFSFQLNRINPSGGEETIGGVAGSPTVCFQLNRINPSGGVLLRFGLTLSPVLWFPTKPH